MSRHYLARFVVTTMFSVALGASLNRAAAQAPTVTYTDLHEFSSGSGDPINFVDAGVIPQGRAGNLYGVSTDGGSAGAGTVYKIGTEGTLALVASLDSAKGENPQCGLTLGSDGNFYGAAVQGGSSNAGTIYKVSSSGTVTVLYQFSNGSDGSGPSCPPVEAGNGDYYGTTNGLFESKQSASTFYRITSSGTFAKLHTFALSEGNRCSGVALGADGNFYGACLLGGAHGLGTLYKISPAGVVTVLHSLVATDGQNEQGEFLVQAGDGNFYGMGFNGGSKNYGVIFRLTPSGTYTVLHNFTGGSDGGNPNADLTVGRDGYLYGAASIGGSTAGCSAGCGTLFKISTAGVFTVLHTFDGTQGSNPQSNLTLDTDGLLYGITNNGGASNDGVFFSLNVGFAPFVTLVSTSGTIGSTVGIMGQDFDSASVVKFNGVAATKIALNGTTYITATIPAGATDGKVTVTTGTTTLTSTQTFTVHNTWSKGKAMPTAVTFATAAVLDSEVYVIGGKSSSGTVVADVQIYNPATGTWSTGKPYPTSISFASAAVVDNILYVFGGTSNESTATNAVYGYNPTTKEWTGKAAMLTARWSTAAAVENNVVYVVGGSINASGDGFVATVESYNPATNTWKEESPLTLAKSQSAAGLVGSTIVVADGAINGSGATGNNEGYAAATNKWSTLTADPTERFAGCFGPVGTTFYDVSGYLNNAGAGTTVNESFTLSTNKWTTTLAPIPQGTIFPASAVYNGQIYCIGGWATWNGAPINNVQIYQP